MCSHNYVCEWHVKLPVGVQSVVLLDTMYISCLFFFHCHLPFVPDKVEFFIGLFHLVLQLELDVGKEK